MYMSGIYANLAYFFYIVRTIINTQIVMTLVLTIPIKILTDFKTAGSLKIKSDGTCEETLPDGSVVQHNSGYAHKRNVHMFEADSFSGKLTVTHATIPRAFADAAYLSFIQPWKSLKSFFDEYDEARWM